MVDPVMRILRSFPSSPTRINTSTSISSEPDNAWVAARQARINADLLTLKRADVTEDASDDSPSNETEGEIETLDDRHAQSREDDQASEKMEASGEEAESHRFSGESDEIGTRNFDDDTPFGERVAIV
ncbi:MAG TPA: hypothetical protein VL202_11005 [Pararhizobium sp.]|uniref:hypothetical protein n=1 Tax=Pararhizobium sp. TaxID=1977563 RepID=UPI002C3F92A9|nr:hypothetical protein [Pararhizobium sp.]HTO31689.1 hypothetical protein [Pararhizobium sp.]